jgi:hypothetical protein
MNRRGGVLPIVLLAWIGGVAAPAASQERPFVFSLANVRTENPVSTTLIRVDYDLGGGERFFQQDRGDHPEQQIALHATHGRFTLVGRTNLVSTGGTIESAVSGEVIVALRRAERFGASLAAGGGVLREIGGVNVLTARVIAGRETETWRLHGNVIFQKPLDPARDTVDLITSAGWARRVTAALALGVEAIGEDLEGFWDPAEAEGGARLLVGPSVRVAPARRRWQLLLAGGPALHARDTGRTSDATRALPPSDRRSGYAVKAALAIRVQ